MRISDWSSDVCSSDLRLERQTASAMKIVEGLSTHPSIERVLFPPLPDDPGHALWRRDFTGASGVFSVVLEPNSDAALAAFLAPMRLFRLGASWGGLHSLEIGSAQGRARWGL